MSNRVETPCNNHVNSGTITKLVKGPPGNKSQMNSRSVQSLVNYLCSEALERKQCPIVTQLRQIIVASASLLSSLPSSTLSPKNQMPKHIATGKSVKRAGQKERNGNISTFFQPQSPASPRASVPQHSLDKYAPFGSSGPTPDLSSNAPPTSFKSAYFRRNDSTDSRAQQKLFDLIQGDSTPKNIQAEITHHHAQGRELPWFQDVIPELVPGVSGNAPWLADARALLWTSELFAQHNNINEQKEATKTIRKKIDALPNDEFGFRKQWSVVVKYLQPMSYDMQIAANEVSRALARTDCLQLTVEHTNAVEPDKSLPHKSYFTVSRSAVQDKILSPLIEALTYLVVEQEAQLATLDAKAEGTQDPVKAQMNPQEQAEELVRKHQQNIKLEKALQVLRNVIVEEKGSA
ncbi:Nn.00g007300.m01.CDS01 [Neocucurbitaria sp. VM-36]